MNRIQIAVVGVFLAVLAMPASALELGARLMIARNGMLSTSIRSITVAGVIEGCAASQAGIRAGDRITEVGGMAVQGASLFKLKSKLDGAPDGTKVPVVIERGGQSVQTSLTAGVKCPKR